MSHPRRAAAFGISPQRSDIEPAAYGNVIAVNLMSALHMTHLVLPHMINHSSKDNQCNIVSTTSVGGLTGVINLADYCASKSGLIGLTRGLALEFAGRGVRVNAIAPGMIMTDMLRGVSQDELNALAATIPQATSVTCPTSQAPSSTCSAHPT